MAQLSESGTQGPPIAVVTGASRGAGAGIAHALGSHGCDGLCHRAAAETAGELQRSAGTIHQTAELVTAAGGQRHCGPC